MKLRGPSSTHYKSYKQRLIYHSLKNSFRNLFVSLSTAAMAENGGESRKDRRKAAKREKRKQKRREMAVREKEEEEAKLNDPEEIRRVEIEEARERERVERDRKQFEERETLFLMEMMKKKKTDEERERREEEEEELLKLDQVPHEDENESDWEYVEDGPPEIIWQGNEIIVKKKKIKVKRKDADQQLNIEESGRPISNPLPPESEPFVDSNNRSVVSAQQVLDNAAQQIPNFGTEQDKAHCPFQIKTGACRFGLRCSRLHFYPDKSCTLLIKNMYNGPGLAFEQDEGLEHTDEEVDRCFEEFYEDVHTEFLKFGEIVNFKVCKNSSFHLRGNLYVHYMSQDSAMLAYQSVNGRYFAGKQVTCEFVGVTKWRVAICGEFMRSRLKTCSRGTACNFIHCFRNPGGDYEWADWDKPPPKYWVQEMASLFGHSQHSSERTTDMNRRPSKRSQSRESRSSRDHHHEEYDSRRSKRHKTYRNRSRKEVECHQSENGVHDSDFDRDQSTRERGEDRHHHNTRGSITVLDNQDCHKSRTCRSDSNSYWSDIDRERDRKRNRDRDRDRKREEDIHYKPNGSTPKRRSRDKWDNFNASEFMVEDGDIKKDEDVYYKPKKKSRDKLDSANDSELILADKYKKGDEDAPYKPKGKRSTSKRKSRDRWDSADDSDFMLEGKDRKRDKDVHYNSKEKSSTAKKKSRDRWVSAEDIEFMVEEKDRKRDGDVYYKRNEKSSTHKRKNRDKWDNADDSEFMVDDKDSKKGEDVYYKWKGESLTPKRRSMDKWDSADDSELMVEEDKSKSRKSSRKSLRHSNEEREFIEGQDRWDDKVGVEYNETSRRGSD